MASEKGKRSTATIVVVAGLISLVLLGVICFGCFGGLTFFGWGVYKEQAQAVLNENAVVDEHLGEIQSMDLDLMASGETGGDNTFVFDVQGTKGTAVITVEFETEASGGEVLVGGTMELPDGTVHDLLGDAEGPPDER